jgi:hypothetical protein
MRRCLLHVGRTAQQLQLVWLLAHQKTTMRHGLPLPQPLLLLLLRHF